MTAQQWADLSNMAIYSTMFVLVLAMIFFAASFAGRRTSRFPCRACRGAPGRSGGRRHGRRRQPGMPGPFLTGPTAGAAEPGRRAGNIAMALTWLGVRAAAGGRW